MKARQKNKVSGAKQTIYQQSKIITIAHMNISKQKQRVQRMTRNKWGIIVMSGSEEPRDSQEEW